MGFYLTRVKSESMWPAQSALGGWRLASLCIYERLPENQGAWTVSACSHLLTQALVKLRGPQLSTAIELYLSHH